MPHVDRDCSYFWSSRLCAAICISTVYTPLYRRIRRWDREREREERGGGKGVKRGEIGGDPKRAFFESCIDLRPPSRNRSTANKSRRFLRRAARVRSCPVFGNDENVRLATNTRKADQQQRGALA